MTKLEYIKSKVVEVNPEIMELKFGCEVKNKTSNDYRIILRGVAFKGGMPMLCDSGMFRRVNVHYFPIENVEILGRPIRLADVLHTLDEGSNQEIVVHIDGELGIADEAIIWKNTYWNLQDNNLTNQSEECINFLAEVLGYKE